MSNFYNDSEDKQHLTDVSRAYRDARDHDAGGKEPPVALDDAIRAAARRAVLSGPQPVGKSGLRRWTREFAMAAVVVLSVSVVLVAIDERPELAPAPIQHIALNRAAETPAVAAPDLQGRRNVSSPEIAAGAVPVLTADAVNQRSYREKDTADGVAQGARQRTAPLAKEARATSSISSPPQVASAGAALPAPATPAAAGVTGTAGPARSVAAVAPAPFPATVADAAAPMSKQARTDGRATEAPRIMEEKVAMAGAMRARKESDVPAAASVRATPTNSALTTAPAAAAFANPPMLKDLKADTDRSNAQASGATAIRAPHPAYAPIESFDESTAAGPWLKRMLALREQNRLKELRDEIARFKKYHPAVILPKSLTSLPPE